jgi:large subunit ribosomal protein L23
MAIFDILKKKRKPEKKKKIKKEVEKTPKVEVEKSPKERKKTKGKRKAKTKKISLKASLILKEPHVTEKATNLAREEQYVFKVFPKANKTEIKKAIEELYGVDVLQVRIIYVPKKKRRLGKIEGYKKGYKKAIVKIKKGQEIEVMPR